MQKRMATTHSRLWALFAAACFCAVGLADHNCDYADPEGKLITC